MNRIDDEYTVGELARISGVSVRTLHHYDRIGLLAPAHVAANGYRLYRRPQLLRLQEILFCRAVGMPLKDIADHLDRPGDPVARLREHRAAIAREIEERTAMLATLDATIAHLKGEHDMTIDDLYRPFAPEKQAEYEAWLIEKYGPDMKERIRAAQARYEAAPEGEMRRHMERLRLIEADLVQAFEAGVEAGDAVLGPMLERHRHWVGAAWGRACEPAAYAGLAGIYRHPDFAARFERLSPRLSDWLPRAMEAHAAQLGT